MLQLQTRLLAVALAPLVWICAAARPAQERKPEAPRPGAAPAPAEASAQAAAPPALDEDAREALEHLRQVLAVEGRDSARELLAETVSALSEPAPGAEESHVAYLLELDGLAEELGSLKEAKDLREAVLGIRERLLASDHRDLLNAKRNLAVTKKKLGDLAGALELEEAVLEARERLFPPDHPDLLDAKLSLAATKYTLGDLAGAHEDFEAVHDASARLLPPDHPDLLRAKQNLAATMKELGDLRGARELEEAVLEARERLLPPDHPDLLRAKQNLAVTRAALGDLAGARELEEAVLEARERLLPPDHPDLLDANQNLAATMVELGDFHGARELFWAVLEARARLLPPDHPDLLRAKQNLAVTMKELGDLRGARELEEAVLEARERLLPPDHPDLLAAKLSLAETKKELGDLQGALELEEALPEAWTRLLPPDHPNLLAAKQNLAVTKKVLGDLHGARELFEAVLEARARLLPPDHSDLLAAKLNLAVTKKELGDLQGARELEEAVLEAWTRLLPPDHPDLLAAKLNVAVTKKELGDLQGARELEEAVLEARARLLPPDHPDLLDAKQNLAGTRCALGDLSGAHELFEAALEARTRLLPHDHPELLAAKQNLAVTRKMLGDINGARELEEAVLEAWTRLLPPDHPDLLDAKQNLAVTKKELADISGALELEEAVLAARTRLFPPDHPDLLAAKLNLAVTKKELADIGGALELFEAVHEAWTRLLPPDHPDLLAAKLNLAVTRNALGDLAGAREVVSSLLGGVRARARAIRAEAARAARESARAELQRFFEVLSSQLGDSSSSLHAQVLSTLEELRVASVGSAEVAHALADHPELEALARDVAQKRTELHDLAAMAPEEADEIEEWRRSLVVLAEDRDHAERELRRKLGEAGAFVGQIDARSVAARLPPGVAMASFLRYPRCFEKDSETGEWPPSIDSLLSFVATPDGAVHRIELGPAEELEGLVLEWRASLGKPIERGIAGEKAEERPEAEIGRMLRARLLDPVLAAAGEDVRALHVVLDDLLFLVPLDALALEDGTPLGERIAIHVEATLARLVRTKRPLPPAGRLVAVGGVDFDAQEKEHEGGGPALVVASTPPLERSGRPERFEGLLQTRLEVEAVGVQFEDAFAEKPQILLRGEATKAALHAAAPGARFLHLATHGWFASERFKSQLDSLAEQGARSAFERAEATLTGFAPETLCGLALAGANRGKDSLGRVPGILTAEELASFDLRNCELAVLSACETNVGIRRAGQGIQSLQTSLHAAGARTAITSLWKVDDAATRRLFELFYTKLWKEKLGKADALWQAKMALRAEGHPPRDWAGWILSGDPE